MMARAQVVRQVKYGNTSALALMILEGEHEGIRFWLDGGLQGFSVGDEVVASFGPSDQFASVSGSAS